MYMYWTSKHTLTYIPLITMFVELYIYVKIILFSYIIQCRTIQYSIVHYIIVQYNTIQYST